MQLTSATTNLAIRRWHHRASTNTQPPSIHSRQDQASLHSFPYGHYAEIKDQDLSGHQYDF